MIKSKFDLKYFVNLSLSVVVWFGCFVTEEPIIELIDYINKPSDMYMMITKLCSQSYWFTYCSSHKYPNALTGTAWNKENFLKVVWWIYLVLYNYNLCCQSDFRDLYTVFHGIATVFYDIWNSLANDLINICDFDFDLKGYKYR